MKPTASRIRTAVFIAAIHGCLLAPTAAGAEDAAETGHYVRLGTITAMYRDASFKDEDCLAVNPDALYGCGKDAAGNDRQSFVNFDTDTGFQIGYGYRIAPLFRLEASLERQRNIGISGDANFLAPGRRQKFSSSADMLSFILWGFAETPGVATPFGGDLNLFAGVGIGLSRISLRRARIDFPATYTAIPNGSTTNEVFGVAVGVSQKIGERIIFDITWRYMDYGVVKTGSGDGAVVFRSDRSPILLHLAATEGRIKGNELLFSVRIPF